MEGCGQEEGTKRRVGKEQETRMYSAKEDTKQDVDRVDNLS